MGAATACAMQTLATEATSTAMGKFVSARFGICRGCFLITVFSDTPYGGQTSDGTIWNGCTKVTEGCNGWNIEYCCPRVVDSSSASAQPSKAQATDTQKSVSPTQTTQNLVASTQVKKHWNPLNAL